MARLPASSQYPLRPEGVFLETVQEEKYGHSEDQIDSDDSQDAADVEGSHNTHMEGRGLSPDEDRQSETAGMEDDEDFQDDDYADDSEEQDEVFDAEHDSGNEPYSGDLRTMHEDQHAQGHEIPLEDESEDDKGAQLQEHEYDSESQWESEAEAVRTFDGRQHADQVTDSVNDGIELDNVPEPSKGALYSDDDLSQEEADDADSQSDKSDIKAEITVDSPAMSGHQGEDDLTARPDHHENGNGGEVSLANLEHESGNDLSEQDNDSNWESASDHNVSDNESTGAEDNASVAGIAPSDGNLSDKGSDGAEDDASIKGIAPSDGNGNISSEARSNETRSDPRHDVSDIESDGVEDNALVDGIAPSDGSLSGKESDGADDNASIKGIAPSDSNGDIGSGARSNETNSEPGEDYANSDNANGANDKTFEDERASSNVKDEKAEHSGADDNASIKGIAPSDDDEAWMTDEDEDRSEHDKDKDVSVATNSPRLHAIRSESSMTPSTGPDVFTAPPALTTKEADSVTNQSRTSVSMGKIQDGLTLDLRGGASFNPVWIVKDVVDEARTAVSNIVHHDLWPKIGPMARRAKAQIEGLETTLQHSNLKVLSAPPPALDRDSQHGIDAGQLSAKAYTPATGRSSASRADIRREDNDPPYTRSKRSPAPVESSGPIGPTSASRVRARDVDNDTPYTSPKRSRGLVDAMLPGQQTGDWNSQTAAGDPTVQTDWLTDSTTSEEDDPILFEDDDPAVYWYTRLSGTQIGGGRLAKSKGGSDKTGAATSNPGAWKDATVTLDKAASTLKEKLGEALVHLFGGQYGDMFTVASRDTNKKQVIALIKERLVPAANYQVISRDDRIVEAHLTIIATHKRLGPLWEIVLIWGRQMRPSDPEKTLRLTCTYW